MREVTFFVTTGNGERFKGADGVSARDYPPSGLRPPRAWTDGLRGRAFVALRPFLFLSFQTGLMNKLHPTASAKRVSEKK